jgi:hypothetical protein
VPLSAFNQLREDWSVFRIAQRRRSSAFAVALIVLAALAVTVVTPFLLRPPPVPAAKPLIVNNDAARLYEELEKSTPTIGLEFADARSIVPPAKERQDRAVRWAAVASRSRGELLAMVPPIANLPFLGDDQCHIEPGTAEFVAKVSQSVQKIQPTFERRVHSTAVSHALVQWLDDPQWRRPEAVRTITQIFQVENDRVRLRLVEYLAAVPGPEAGKGLVDRAVFDLNPDVRADAVAALAKRPLADYREHLPAAFRHPWPAAARHAAEAVVKLNRPELTVELEKLAPLPDPRLAVRNEQGKWLQTEMVRINHLSNCMLCHPTTGRPGTSETMAVNFSAPDATAAKFDPSIGLVAFVPASDSKLPGQAYGPSSEGPTTQIRADIVYLRQDFSLLHQTTAYDPWPIMQRYDYVVRTRPATEEEIARAVSAAERGPESYPQRDALDFALAHLKPPAMQTAAR